MQSAAKVTVAGAGALGLSCALALADAGCEVTVWDPAEPFANASGVAAGMLAPVFEAVLDAEAAAHFDLLLAARDLWPALEARSGVRLDRAGALAAGRGAWIAEVAAGVTRLGLHPTELPRTTAEDLAPGLSGALEAMLLSREDWRLDPRAGLAALRLAAAAAGVAFRREAVADRGAADILVIATGAAQGLADLAPELAVLTPIKGHILRIAAPRGGGVTVRGEGVYAVPAEGGLAIGATMEPGVADPAIDPAKVEPLAAAGARLFPAVAGAPHELFAGVRAATPDGLPLVGASATPGVLLATGARRNGWLLAPLVAQTIAACVTGRELGPYAGRLDPARFRGGA
ncbi:D-amino-acid oxidase [Phenylobacterium hankyongense]|uniref:D-amino-acid oxidase n=1 Tax=Phenylobacterium hankyongense TaxID=1813876 RepID=A0A328AUP3_9CAUL|nr:FAD-dependent oxidoreductase [Phenylobacterium hankyongense]RAK58347.1 D-amino-acid oxidase [Phenylobacterium hankyongense]